VSLEGYARKGASFLREGEEKKGDAVNDRERGGKKYSSAQEGSITFEGEKKGGHLEWWLKGGGRDDRLSS